MMELETIWNGSHLNADADLLCTPRIPEKRRDVPIERTRTVCLGRGGGAMARVEQALLLGAPLSCREVEERTGLSHGSAQSAIFELRRMGAVIAVKSQKVKGMGRYETVYGLTEQA